MLLGELAKQLEHLVAAGGVEAVRGLVQEQQLRIVDQRGGQLEPLLHAQGVLVRLAVALFPQAHEVHDLVGALEGRAARHARQPAHVGHHVDAEQAGDEALALRHVAHLSADRNGLPGGIETQDARLPLGRKQAEQDAQQGRLPRPVGSQKAGRSRPDLAGDPVEGDGRTECLSQAMHGEDHRG